MGDRRLIILGCPSGGSDTDGWANLEKPLAIHFSLRSVLDRVAPLITALWCYSVSRINILSLGSLNL